MKKRIGTVCFIIKENKVLLALIEYSPNDKKWNGIGGFVEKGEASEDAVIREVKEELDVKIDKKDLIRAKELDIEMRLIVFITKDWKGEMTIKDSSLKELKWFTFDKVPYSQMFRNNDKWLPEVLKLA